MAREFVQVTLLIRRVLPPAPLVLDRVENSGLLRFMHCNGRVTRHDLGRHFLASPGFPVAQAGAEDRVAGAALPWMHPEFETSDDPHAAYAAGLRVSEATHLKVDDIGDHPAAQRLGTTRAAMLRGQILARQGGTKVAVVLPHQADNSIAYRHRNKPVAGPPQRLETAPCAPS